VASRIGQGAQVMTRPAARRRGSRRHERVYQGAPAEVWSPHGASHPLGGEFTGAQDIIPHAFDEQTVLSLTADVPPSLLKQVLLTGTPNEVIEQVAQWRDQGLRYAVLGNLSTLQSAPRSGGQPSLHQNPS
jgi:alkanesulfonate monooxygenase SsuD/methylene tetrahydromethanopterin reductase-like flavin-dependent oxidoreductase (luciferase family)